MPVQALTQVDPQQFFNLSSANGAGTSRLDTKVSGVAVSNDFAGRLSRRQKVTPLPSPRILNPTSAQ